MADADTAADDKLKVFISYSRKDEDFALELLAGLQLAGFEPYLDKHDIAAGEDWEVRLGRLIEAADTVVFVISPDSITSARCAWEVERAITLKKRLLPILWRRVDDAQVPSTVKQLNYIYFDKPMMSVPSLTALSAALRTDLGWVREHTRIGEAAFRWHARGRNEALLFRGDELATAKAWLASPPEYAPEPTLLHLDFIKASEVAELARTSQERQQLDRVRRYQNRFSVVLALLSILVFCIGAASVFFYRDSQLRDSSAFAILSDEYLESGFPDRAMRFALAGLPKFPNSVVRPWSLDAERALVAAYASNQVRFVFTEHHASVHDVAFSPDGTRIASASDDKTARVWNIGRAEQSHVLKGHGDAVAYVLFSPDGRRIVTVGHDTTRVWDARSGKLVSVSEERAGTEMRPVFMSDGQHLVIQVDWRDLAILDTETGRVKARFSGHTDYLNSASISSDGRYILTASADKSARLWSIAEGALVRNFEGHGDVVTGAVMSADGSRVFTSSLDGSVRIWDAGTGRELQQLKYKNDRFTTLVLPKSSSFIIASSYEGHAIVWDLSASEPKYVFEHADTIIDMELNGDENRLLTAGWDRRARVWDLASGRRLADLKGHQGRIWNARFQPGQSNVVTASEDATVRFWNYEERLKSIARMENVGHSFVATTDNSLLLAQENGKLHQWTVRGGSIAEEQRTEEGKRILGVCGSEQRTLIFARSASGDLVSGDFAGPCIRRICAWSAKTLLNWHVAKILNTSHL
jgi:WD40 repeat protein